MADRTTDTEPRDLQLRAYNWTTDRGAPGREVWHIDAGNEWHTREDAEAAIARHEARIRADERAKLSKALHRMAVEETESDARSAGLHEAAMFVESDGASHGEPAACTHPKDRRIATYDEPGAFTCVACGLSVSTLSPAPEPAVPDPWPLPAGLEWGHDGYEPNGWHITDRRRRWAVWIHEDGSVVGTLPRCNDATLIDLIRLRNAAEPTGPKK